MDTNQIDKAVSTRARVRITDRNGWAKGAEGIAIGFRSLYSNIKVGFVDTNGSYTGEYTMVHYANVDIIEDEDATQQPRTTKTTARRRPTATEARIKRHMRRLQRQADTATRNAARAAHRAERHTIASHLRNLGVDEATATGMAATLRKRITPGVRGYALKDGIRRRCTCYTLGQMLAALVDYKPRKKAFQDARAHLLTLAA